MLCLMLLVKISLLVCIYSKKTAHKVWKEFETIHVGSKKLPEEKFQVLKENGFVSVLTYLVSSC